MQIKYRLFPLIILCGYITFNFKSLFTQELNNHNIENQSINYYRLGPGDRLIFKIYDFKQFDSLVNILPDGTINLPRLNPLYISNLTIREAKEKITNSYKKILKNPIIYLDLKDARPIKITVLGAVQRPGFYSLGLNEKNLLMNSAGGQSTVVSSRGWPSLIDAIQKAGGVKSNADLRNVILLRNDPNNIKRRKPVIYNFWEVLNASKNIKNPYIYDGDVIKINFAESQTSNEMFLISSSNLAPATITVNVVGEVKKPGPQKIKANSPLSIALLNAGGVTNSANKSSIILYRLNNNGSISSQKLSYKPKNQIDDKLNPPLKDKDVVMVGRDNLSKTSDFLSKIVSPVTPIINGYSLFKIINTD